MKTKILLICIILLHHQAYSAELIDSVYLNFQKIILTPTNIIQVSNTETKQGEQMLDEINIKGLNNFEKTKKIESYVRQNFKFKIKSLRTITEIIDKGGGNCLSHGILGIFLLRLAGVPAKLCYEFQLRKPMYADHLRANIQNTGIFGSGYNTHIWVLFFDGNKWQPYDSSLGIVGFQEFFSTRTSEKENSFSFDPKKLIGPPFLILQETGKGYIDMENITSSIWNQNYKWNNNKFEKGKWLSFTEQFYYKGYEYFEKPLEKNEYKEIKEISKKWFR